MFKNHVLVKRDKIYYDPSYGTGPFTELKLWEDDAQKGAMAAFLKTGYLRKNDPNKGETKEK